MSLPLKTGFLTAALALVAGFTASAQTERSADAAISCRIEKIEASGGITLNAIAESPKAIAGTYLFEVQKRGGGGISSSAQSGDFELKADETAVLGVVGLGGSDRLTYDAHLTLTSPDGKLLCRHD
ncbi:curli-like amyloid fiber formation chaperone CsgH [Aurantimonas sp. E1-2-R+4]|uniref:curli-like amyloid fiber formation chaperone CsgH n=1 Tax=Aurantimonas sp. E1-2-R+4 TaxID=3113714 RepID=UPI002F94003B